MANARKHNKWELLKARWITETRFSLLCTVFDIEHSLAISLAGIELWMERIIFTHNLCYSFLVSEI